MRAEGDETAGAAQVAVLPDGARVEIDGAAMILRDGEGRLLVRYERGHAEIAAPSGDLRLRAPGGRVSIESATDITLSAERDVTTQAGRRVDLVAGNPGSSPAVRVEPARLEVRSRRLHVEAEHSHLTAGEASVVARTVTTTAERIAHHAERYEIEATRLFERTRDSFREVADLCQSRAGRVRTVVRDVYALWSRRSTLISQDDTSIDGKRVLLG